MTHDEVRALKVDDELLYGYRPGFPSRMVVTVVEILPDGPVLKFPNSNTIPHWNGPSGIPELSRME
jgi:hypothetical protein